MNLFRKKFLNDKRCIFPKRLRRWHFLRSFDLYPLRKIQRPGLKLMRSQIVESERFIWGNSIEISHYDALEVGCVSIPRISTFNASVSLQTTQINLFL